MNSLKLRRLSIPGITSYSTAESIQQSIVRAFLDRKANLKLPPCLPTIVTAQFNPVYTSGRRELGNVSLEQQNHLRANGKAEFYEALRGGQTTFHGPGQLVAYPILDLKRHRLTPRTYICLLEKALIATCARYGIQAMTTEHTGVWTTPDKKIAAIGVHLRRNITSHGIGLNINTDLHWFNRIVACGLADKTTTSFTEEGVLDKNVEEVGDVFTEEVASRLGASEIVTSFDPDKFIP